MNIYDVSKKAGVSIATVSRVINGSHQVSPLTRDKVLKVIEENGYTPNTFARGLGSGSMRTIGLMCADASDPFISKAIHYLQQGLREYHYDALLCCTGFELKDKRKYIDLLLTKRVDAMILIGSNFVEKEATNNDYIHAAAKRVPIMILNGAMAGYNIYSTLCDDYNAVYQATEHMIEAGFRHLHYLYNAQSYSGNRKKDGFLAALKAHNLAQEPNVCHFVDGAIDEARALLEKLMSEAIPMDGIIASDDALALGALKFAKKAGIIVPDELSIIGFNNSMISTCSDPELTSIDNRLETLCTGCINTLMGVFSNQAVPIETVYPAELICRGTTAF